MVGTLRIDDVERSRGLSWPLVGHHSYITGGTYVLYTTTLDDLCFIPETAASWAGVKGTAKLECYELELFEGFSTAMTPGDVLAHHLDATPKYVVKTAQTEFTSGGETKSYALEPNLEQELSRRLGENTIIVSPELMDATINPLEMQVVDFLNAEPEEPTELPAQPKRGFLSRFRKRAT